MAVRRTVAEAWARRVESDPVRAGLGRSGVSLASCEDIDLAFTACDLGLASGRFVALRLTHIIPKGRLELAYMERLVEGVNASQVLLRSLRESLVPEPPPRLLARLLAVWTRLRMDRPTLCLMEAARRGRARGFAALAVARGAGGAAASGARTPV